MKAAPYAEINKSSSKERTKTMLLQNDSHYGKFSDDEYLV
jgi:hypothetical protein